MGEIQSNSVLGFLLFSDSFSFPNLYSTVRTPVLRHPLPSVHWVLWNNGVTRSHFLVWHEGLYGYSLLSLSLQSRLVSENNARKSWCRVKAQSPFGVLPQAREGEKLR